MNESAVADYITGTFEGVETQVNLGYTFFFYRSERIVAFATIASTGNEYETISDLDRPGVYRLNIGVSRETFEALFGPANKLDLSKYDFTALDVIMPHPDYARQHFICVLSPGDATFEKVRGYLAEAYDIAAQKFARRNKAE